MCEYGTYRLVPSEKFVGGPYRRKEIPIDECIADIVIGLNKAGVETIACCCGHGKENGEILLADNRKITIEVR